MSVKRFIVRGGTEYDPSDGRIRQVFRCKSTDEKPKNGVGAFDLLIEMDTSNVYFWDVDISDWAIMG